MATVLVLGVGLQGKATLYDLIRSKGISEVIAADRDLKMLQAYVDTLDSDAIRIASIDARDSARLIDLMGQGVDIVIDLLPSTLCHVAAEAAVEARVPLVNACYAHEIEDLNDAARAAGVTLLPESGMDPGIDLVLAGLAVSQVDEVHDVITYGSGFPEAEAADNPIRYKITWTWEGVLRSYYRSARILVDSDVVRIPAENQFANEYIHTVKLEGVGTLEAFPNEDAIRYAEKLGILNTAKNVARYVARWPGHCAFWKKIVDLKLLSDEPMAEIAAISPREFLTYYVGSQPQMQYREDERDVAWIHVEVRGLKDGKQREVIYDVVDFRDLETGFFAMNRTTGFTASIMAQMILDGTINKRGVLSPLCDVPPPPFLQALRKRDVSVTGRISDEIT